MKMDSTRQSDENQSTYMYKPSNSIPIAQLRRLILERRMQEGGPVNRGQPCN